MSIAQGSLPALVPQQKTFYQVTDTVLADADVTLTMSELLHFALSMTPTVARILTLPDAIDILGTLRGIASVTVADSIEFIVRNFGTANITLNAGTGGSFSPVGVITILPDTYRRFVLRLDPVFAYTVLDAGPPPGTVIGADTVLDNTVAIFDGISGKLLKQTDETRPIKFTSDANFNMMIGIGAKTYPAGSTNNIAIGRRVLTTAFDNYDNVAIGNDALRFCETGYENVAIGDNALGALTTGFKNFALGADAGVSLTEGSSNLLIGRSSGDDLTSGDRNVMIGQTTGNLLTTGNDNVLIGSNASTTAPGVSEAIAIGAGAAGTSAPNNNQIFIDGDPARSATQSLFVPRLATGSGTPMTITGAGQIVQTPSSRRYKKNIQDLSDMDAVVDQLRPVRFDYRDTDQHSLGLIAEEVFEVLPEVVPLNAHGEPHSVNYSLLTAVLLQAVQQLKARVAVLEKQ